jgi:very-short-patch-repair endonuclease
MRRQVSKNQEVGEAMRRKSRQLRRQMTPEETLFWQALRGERLDSLHFRRQQVIGPYSVDFYCLSVGIIVKAFEQMHAELVLGTI